MSDGIWNGIKGPTYYYCPFCGEFWPPNAIAEYDEHMKSHEPKKTDTESK